MTDGSLPGLISQPSKIFKSYQIQMQNVNFTCITFLPLHNYKCPEHLYGNDASKYDKDTNNKYFE